ncbi:MAG TPA: methylmalonyl-CoA mutase family protein [Desulfobacteraceae bacterium]|nr:methylmalonyl-CoA mutase family protein [Desulfobacteraceae bacterium]HPJ68568.1 methylmalonyl-CoA mutase family protein [Desulfobacteraceae bacterium]
MKRQTDYGYEIKPVYTPEDIADIDYAKDIGDPGLYPYVRGYYPNGYRNRVWTRRMTAGLGSSKRTNEILKQYREMGQTQGILVICDRPNAMPIDADHPIGRREAGVLGWHGASLLEFEELMDGIPLTGQSITLLGSSAMSCMRLAYVVALAEKRGIDFTEVHGSVTEYPFCSTFGQTDHMPLDLLIKLWMDSSEFIVRNKIHMRCGILSQHFQESGGNNAQALAVEIAQLKELLGLLVNERGLHFDDLALLPYELVSIGSRFFEEIAKVRALRRMYAKMAKETFKAKNEKACQLLISIHTSGRTMTYQQPLNNIARCAIQTLAGAIAGCTAIDNACLDNAHAEPSAFAARMSLNTQHIVSDETGVTDVTDPLAGSYFVEYLTNRIESEAYKILQEIENQGGMTAAVKKGYIHNMMEESARKRQKEIESGERLVVGVNELVIPPEEDDDIPIQSVEASDSEKIAKRMEQWRKTRNIPLLKEKIEQVHADAKKGRNFNLMPSIIEAVKAYGTAGEIMGVIRMANGFHYDPLEMIECPFDL